MENELIKVTTNENGQKLVSARELYLGLGLNKAHWKRWSEQNISKNEFFLENQDWTGFTIMVNGNETKDFAITLRFAQHIAMMARTEKSHIYRDYLIECERQALQISTEDKVILKVIKSNSQEERMIALVEYKELITAPLIDKIEQDAPKVEAYQQYMDSDGLYTVTNVAKFLNMKRDDLYKWLRDKELVYKQKRVCTVKAESLGIMEMKIKNGYECLYVTPKGVEYIRNKLEKEEE